MKKFILVLITMLVCYSLTANELNLSLSATIDSVLQNNEKLALTKEVVEQKRNLHKASISNYFPEVNLLAGYTYINQNTTLNMDKMKNSIDRVMGKYGAKIASELGLTAHTQDELYDIIVTELADLPAYDIEIDQQKFKNANLVVTQPLFTGGKITAGRNYARAELNLSQEQLRQTEDNLILKTTNRYLSLILIDKILALRENVLNGMKRHSTNAKKAIKVGVIPPHEILRAQVAVANARRDLTDTRNDLKLLKSSLQTLLNLKIDNLTIIPEQILSYKKTDLDLEQLQSVSMNNNRKLKMIDQKKCMANQAYNLERSSLFPQILAHAEYNFFREDYPMTLPAYSVGLQLDLNLFHGFKKYYELSSARHLEKEVEKAKKYAEDEISLLVTKLYNETIDHKTRYLEFKPSLELAKKNLQINEKRFKEGLAKSIDVIDARLLYEKASIERLLSLYKYYVSLAKLYITIGKPEEVATMLPGKDRN